MNIALNQSSSLRVEIDSIVVEETGMESAIARPTEGCVRIERNRLCRRALLLVIAFSFSFAGCQGSQLGSKRWSGGIYGQGTEERQKYRAAAFDPYPLNDIGPEVVGGRPRGFMNPLPEAKRNQIEPLAAQRRAMGSGW